MTLAEIPQEALQAAALAHEKWFIDSGGDPDACYFTSHEKWSKATLEAALPALAAHVRRQTAQQIADLLDAKHWALRQQARDFAEALSSVRATRMADAFEEAALTARQIGDADAER